MPPPATEYRPGRAPEELCSPSSGFRPSPSGASALPADHSLGGPLFVGARRGMCASKDHDVATATTLDSSHYGRRQRPR